MFTRCSLLFALLATPAITLAGPPPVTYLVPSKFVAEVNDTVDLRLAVGTAKGAQVAAWPTTPVDWLCIRGGAVQQNRHGVRPSKTGDNSVPVPIASAGVTLIGLDYRPVVLTMTGRELKAFVAQHGTDEAARAKSRDLKDDAPVRVRHVASAKTLVRASGPRSAADRAGVATSKAGLFVEIRPMFDPTLAKVDADIPVVVYIEGTKMTGIQVQATSLAAADTVAFTIDRGGMGDIHVSHPGVWRVEAHHAAPLAQDGQADWVIYSTTLTFEIPAQGAQS